MEKLTDRSLALCTGCGQAYASRHDCREPRTVPMTELERLVFLVLRRAAIRVRASR